MKARAWLGCMAVVGSMGAWGSAWSAPQDQVAMVAAKSTEQVRFRVSLPLRNTDELATLLANLHDEHSPLFRKWLTPDEFTARFGADPAKLGRIAQSLEARGFKVTAMHATGMSVEGSVASAQSLMSAPIGKRITASGRAQFVAATGARQPAEITNEGARVIGLRGGLEHQTHSRRVDFTPDNRYGKAGPYWFTDLKQAYDFPSYAAYSGKGRTIAIVMANDFLDSDMALYFGHEKLKVPKIVRIPIQGGGPFDPDTGDSFETSLDIQQSGGMAPNATIKLYNLPNLGDDAVMEAYSTIVQTNSADVVSSSFGLFEQAYQPQYNDDEDFTFILDAYEAIFAQGNAQGITFVASSGDSGGLPRPPVRYFTTGPGKTFSWQPDVEHPASSPSVTAVGGTNLLTSFVSGSLASEYVRENAFPDPEIPYDAYGTGNLLQGGFWGSGGGVSGYFKRPDYQTLVPTNAKKRTVPDVSLQMGGCPGGILQGKCPANRSAAIVAVGGGLYGVIGTSVSAPDFAGLLAVEEERLGGIRLGNVNYQIYAQAALQAISPKLKFFHTKIEGSNGYDSTADIYDRVVGVGTPYTRAFIFAPDVAPAGVPQTPSNP